MKKLVFLMIITIFILSPLRAIFADEISIQGVNVFEIKDGKAKIQWSTNVSTKGEIYYGEEEAALNRFMGYSLYDLTHESVLSGLEADKTYHFKIIATDIFGNRTESFVNSFNTDDMEDSTIPIITKYEIIQVIWDSVLIHYQTDEKTKAEFYYGTNESDLNKKVTDSTYGIDNYLYVSKLSPNTKYYIKIKAKDKSGNYQSGATLTFYTGSKPDTANQTIKINSIDPTTNSSSFISSRSVKIKVRTNWASKATVYYGTKESSLSKNEEDKTYNIDHVINIDNLEPNKEYYFKVKVYDSFHNKTKTSPVLKFRTKKLETVLKTGDLIKSPSSGNVYIVQGNNKAWIENENIFNTLGYKWNWIKSVDDATVSKFKEIPNISNTKKHPDGTLIKYENSPAVYLVENKKKRPFFTAEAFERGGYSWDEIITVDKSKWSYSTGEYIY